VPQIIKRVTAGMVSLILLGTGPAVLADPLPLLEQQRLVYGLEVVKRIEKIWPRQFQSNPCQLVFGESGQWLVGCRQSLGMQPVPGQTFDGLPVYWRPDALQLPHTHVPYAQVKQSLVGQGLVYPPGQAALAPYREQPWLIVQRQEDLRRHHPAFAETNTEEWLSLTVHELFHVLFQMSAPSIVAQFDPATQPAGGFISQDPLKALYREQPELQDMLTREHRLLADALTQGPLTSEQAQRLLRQWLHLYEARQERFGTQLAGQYRHWDAFWTFLEGTARYVESRLWLDAGWQAAGLSDPHFTGFSQTRGQGYRALPGANRAMGEAYFYAIGMHLAFVLDQWEPSWPQRVYTQPDWLIGIVREACKLPNVTQPKP
jgi:hypothetical protein